MHLLLIVISIYKIIYIFLIIFISSSFSCLRSSDDGLARSLVDLLTIDFCRIVLALVVPDVDEVAVCCACLAPAAVDPNDVLEVHRLIARLEVVACVLESGRAE